VKDNSASTKDDPANIYFSCLTFVCLHYTGRAGEHWDFNDGCSETTPRLDQIDTSPTLDESTVSSGAFLFDRKTRIKAKD
jgi:hypothetical protein